MMFRCLLPSALCVALLSVPVARAAAPDAVTLGLRDTRPESWTLQGVDDDRWTWQPGGGLVLEADSTEPSSRLISPLPFALDGTTPFSLEMDVTLERLEASPDDFFQVSLGLVNTATTGLNRTGTALPAPPFFIDDADTFDAVEIAYFPNVTPFGGPVLQPTVFGAGTGGSVFWNFAANFGTSADLGDNPSDQVRELPQGVPLRFVMEHDACAQTLVTRVFDMSSRAPVELVTGIEPVDLSVVNAVGTFTVDAVAVNAYFDAADFNPATVSLRARVRVDRAAVIKRSALEARLLPAAVQPAAPAPARVQVRGAAPDALVRLVEIAGVPADEPLPVRASPDGLIAEVDRAIAAAPFTISVGGCRLDLAPERVAGR